MEHATAAAPAVPVDTNTGVDNRKAAVWLFLGSEVMFFAGLIGAYALTRASQQKPVEIIQTAIPIISFNTFVLISSSFTMALSLAFARRGRQRPMKLALLATIGLGCLFLSLQIREYGSLYQEGLTMDGSTYLFGSLFYLMTGIHGLHVLGGVVWLSLVLLVALRGGITARSPERVEYGGLYWHFVDIVWVFIFTIVYLM